MRWCAAFLICLFALPAAAQMPQPPQTLDERVAGQIGALVLQTTRQAMQIELLQKQLAEAQAKLRESKAAAEPPPAAATSPK